MSEALHRLLPRFEFSEHHRAVVRGSRERIFTEIEAVDLSDSQLAQGLMAIWRLGARLVMDNVPNRGMTTQDFIPLALEPPRELVRGLIAGPPKQAWTPEQFMTYDGPGFKLAWSFWVTDLKDGRCRVDTETRVHCNDAKTKRWFTLYWIVIRLPSGAIRRDLLRIIKRRAEGGHRGKG
jgi:hypothetical protein